MSKRITDPGASQHKTAGPYSPVLRIAQGDVVVISGQAPVNPEGEVIGETIEEQALLTLENCKSQLANGGAKLNDVFKVNVYLTDLAEWKRFNSVYSKFMPMPFPARTAIGCQLLDGFKVEIEMWAAP